VKKKEEKKEEKKKEKEEEEEEEYDEDGFEDDDDTEKKTKETKNKKKSPAEVPKEANTPKGYNKSSGLFSKEAERITMRMHEIILAMATETEEAKTREIKYENASKFREVWER